VERYWERVAVVEIPAGTGILLCDTLDMDLLSKLKDFMPGRKGEVLLLCDDLGKLASFWSRRTLTKSGTEDILTHLAYASRHYGISLLYLTQDLTQLATGYRKNFDFVVCLEASIQDQQLMFVELLSNTFRGQCGAFKAYYQAHTGEFNFFVVYKEKGHYQVWPSFSCPQTNADRRRTDANCASRNSAKVGVESASGLYDHETDDGGNSDSAEAVTENGEPGN
jgi:hypothetical protein